ncbi:MAG: hypothetical protein KC503_41210, partial [Myxococcales bacterium]|nr:hypothetical protein [Myxococcales bacterium]
LRWQGRFDESREQAALAAERLRQGSPSWYRAVAEWLTATSRLGEYEQARRWARAAREAQQQDGASSARVGCLCQAARVLFHGGAYESAAELLAESQRVVLADERLDALAVAEVHRLRGAQARHVGDVVGDFDGYSAALEAYQRAGDENNACNARVSVGFALIELGDYARAGELLHDALKRAERMGLSTIATRARQNLALVYAAREDLDAARQALEQAIDESVEQQNVRFANWTRIYLARVELAAGNLERAEQQARQAADELRVTPPARAGALAALAQVLVANGRADEALEAALEAREILERFGGIEEFEALVWIALVETHAALDDQQAARASAERALQRLHEQAERIGEAERPRFLGAVADNARIIELADSYLPESSS